MLVVDSSPILYPVSLVYPVHMHSFAHTLFLLYTMQVPMTMLVLLECTEVVFRLAYRAKVMSPMSGAAG